MREPRREEQRGNDEISDLQRLLRADLAALENEIRQSEAELFEMHGSLPYFLKEQAKL